MLCGNIAHSQDDKQKPKPIIKYKKKQAFDLDALDITGDQSAPGDLSIDPRIQKSFSNKLPYRSNFHPEIKKSVDVIK